MVREAGHDKEAQEHKGLPLLSRATAEGDTNPAGWVCV